MRSMLLGFALMAFVGTSAAADKPNLSGEWKMNVSKSDFGVLPAPESFTRKITHAEPAITIVEEQMGGGRETMTTRTMAVDGKGVAMELNGAPVTASAAWDEAALVAVTVVDSIGLAFKDRMSLSDEGKTLTSKIEITSNQGNAEVTVVFDRQ